MTIAFSFILSLDTVCTLCQQNADKRAFSVRTTPFRRTSRQMMLSRWSTSKRFRTENPKCETNAETKWHRGQSMCGMCLCCDAQVNRHLKRILHIFCAKLTTLDVHSFVQKTQLFLMCLSVCT